MTATLDERTQATALPRLFAPEICDAFVRTLWKDLLAGRATIQTHHQEGLRKNAIEIHGRNYAPLLALHWGLTPTVVDLTGRDLLPSFVFFRIYFEGDVLRVHSDRPACEVSLSLTLASSDSLPWLLSVGTRQADSNRGVEDDFGDEPFDSFPMNAGDALLYRGTERRHGRLDPNPNRWSAHAFFMWVDGAGEHRNEAFERLDLGAAPSF
jgi:hypothetical protein